MLGIICSPAHDYTNIVKRLCKSSTYIHRNIKISLKNSRNIQLKKKKKKKHSRFLTNFNVIFTEVGKIQ